MASFDSLAEVIYLLLGGMGCRVPEDVSLVGFGGERRRGAVAQRLVSVTVDEEAVGRRAAELLHQMRDGERPLDGNDEISVPLGLSDGTTLGQSEFGNSPNPRNPGSSLHKKGARHDPSIGLCAGSVRFPRGQLDC